MIKPVSAKTIRYRIIILVLMFFRLLAISHVHADEILVAAASDLQFAIKDIISDFEQVTGHTVKLSLGSSGNFMNQIINGAPYDLYFSADIEFPRQLEAAGLTVSDSLFEYAVGRIVVWVPNDSDVDVNQLQINALIQPSIRRIAIANPEHAPYGRAAVTALNHYNLYDNLAGKFVMGENISQAAQFIQSGNADIGIIALSLAVAPALKASGRYWEIPLTAFPRMIQGGVILKTVHKQGTLAAASQFADWVTATEGREILKRYGFYMTEEQLQHGQ